MILHPDFNPVAVSLGPLQIHWYSLMYLIAFACAWFIAIGASRRSWSPVKRHQIEDLIVYGAWGVILGGRLGYMFFYSFDRWVEDPSLVIRLWEGGMSFHGALLGVGFGTLFCHQWGAIKVSGAESLTTIMAKKRSRILDWSQGFS